MTLTEAPATTRVALVALTGGITFYALAVATFGVVDLATQLASGSITPTMYWVRDWFSFTDTGDGRPGNPSPIVGTGGSVQTAIPGLSIGIVALHALATLCTLATHFVLAVLAIQQLRRMRHGRPFEGAASRSVAIAALTLLGLGAVSQLLAWWVRVAIIDETGTASFSRDFVFEPLTVTVGLALLLLAFAFRAGERLQRDAEGLI